MKNVKELTMDKFQKSELGNLISLTGGNQSTSYGYADAADVSTRGGTDSDPVFEPIW